MEIHQKKCSLKKHEEIKAISYCTICEKFMCEFCQQFHSDFFDSKHNLFLINSNNFESIKFSENNHNNNKYLKDFYDKLTKKNNELKNVVNIINKNKEETEIKIQRIFTKIRDALNQKEDEAISEIEKRYIKTNILQDIKNNEIVLNKINLSLNQNTNENALLINECKNIENKNNNINNYDLLNDIKLPEEKIIDEIIEKISSLFNINKYIFNSSIIKDDLKKQNILNNWLKDKLNINNIKYELIFKMSENGTKFDDFHKHCDNKGPTMTLIETKNNIFGGFTPLNWNQNSFQTNDKTKKTFLFSLDTMKKYDMFNRDCTAIVCDKRYGPNFGKNDIYFNYNLLKGSVNANDSSNFFEKNHLELTQGKGDTESFDTKEIEVFKVIY